VIGSVVLHLRGFSRENNLKKRKSSTVCVKAAGVVAVHVKGWEDRRGRHASVCSLLCCSFFSSAVLSYTRNT
jgi:hypothetical protein